MAQPPGKRLSTLTLLSGGEQALTAIALIFALFLTNPAPICVLDEVDAPLDDANIERFCDLLDRMTGETDTRYLIVTHNAVTMSRMHRLFGVTMIEKGVSRLVQVDLGGAETPARGGIGWSRSASSSSSIRRSRSSISPARRNSCSRPRQRECRLCRGRRCEPVPTDAGFSILPTATFAEVAASRHAVRAGRHRPAST